MTLNSHKQTFVKYKKGLLMGKWTFVCQSLLLYSVCSGLKLLVQTNFIFIQKCDGGLLFGSDVWSVDQSCSFCLVSCFGWNTRWMHWISCKNTRFYICAVC